MRLSRLLAFALLVTAAPAAAQQPQDRGAALVALAEVLGQSHALRQACAGPSDQYWRARMMRLMDVEQPDERLGARLTDAFNSGYASRRALFRACTPAARRAEAAAAARGRVLTGDLSRTSGRSAKDSRPGPPDEMARGARAP
jgi:uncharacterized protein (TIGR02301 family)